MPVIRLENASKLYKTEDKRKIYAVQELNISI